MEASTIVRRRSEPLFTRLDDDLLAIDVQEGCCYSLNGPAARVWEMIESPTTVGTVCDRLSQEFEVDEATCLADVTELMSELRAAGLIDVDLEPG